MENKIQFYSIKDQEIIDNQNDGEKVHFTLTLPDKLLENFLKEMNIVIIPPKNEFELNCESLCKIWEYIRKLYSNTIGKFYTCEDCYNDIENARIKMYESFEHYTGLNREYCTWNFNESISEFLNPNNGSMFLLLEEMQRQEFDKKLFMRII